MSLPIFEILAEQRIIDAVRRGELDNLPGSGRPLPPDDDAFLPLEQRIANRIMKNAGITPPALTLRKEIAALRAQIQTSGGETRKRARHRLATLLLRLGEMQH